jgi:hypothetical protein
MEFIQGEKFRELANNLDIFYSNTHEVNDFFLNQNITNDFILISHNSDGKIIDSNFNFPNANAKLIPKNLIKWYAQNVNIKHDKIESIPIGMENSQWFPEIGKINKIKEKNKENKNYKNLLYINHLIGTNPNERQKPYDLFSDKSYVTCFEGNNGFDYDSYIDNIYNHKFVICPEGNGIDTHRTWECLYLNTISIEKRNINNSFYKDLPICFVDDWDEINEDFLNKEYDRIKSKIYNLNKLDFNYWKSIITI